MQLLKYQSPAVFTKLYLQLTVEKSLYIPRKVINYVLFGEQ